MTQTPIHMCRLGCGRNAPPSNFVKAVGGVVCDPCLTQNPSLAVDSVEGTQKGGVNSPKPGEARASQSGKRTLLG